MKNPFYYGGIIEGTGFINRTTEKEQLSHNFKNGINTMMISPRRWGKSSLVRATINQLKVNKQPLKIGMLDLFTVRSEEEFYNQFTKACLRASANRLDEILKNAKQLFRGLIPQFSFSPGSGQEDFSISFSWTDSSDKSEVLDLPNKIAEKTKTNVVVCIDEFQNISNFRDPLAFQRQLRSYWQHHRNVSYCLYGSKRHLLTEFFNHSSMPFFRFGDILYLDKIKHTHWRDFISKSFIQTGKRIGEEEINLILSTVDNHPYYIQQLCYYLWNVTDDKGSIELIDIALDQMLQHNRILFMQIVEGMTESQLGILQAICDGETHFNSKMVCCFFPNFFTRYLI